MHRRWRPALGHIRVDLQRLLKLSDGLPDALERSPIELVPAKQE
jgi:hypothetical protein